MPYPMRVTGGLKPIPAAIGLGSRLTVNYLFIVSILFSNIMTIIDNKVNLENQQVSLRPWKPSTTVILFVVI